MEIKISNGNAKMGNINSISLPAITTCRNDCECKQKCYAVKLEKLRKTVRNAYAHNLEVLKENPETYWREIEATIMLSRFFRFHVSGDIPNGDYFRRMVEIAERQSHCEILCFTKKFDIVNAEMDARNGADLPANLHILFSAWKNLKMENPYNFPEAHVRFRDGFTTAREDAIECAGCCEDCAITDSGCWTIKKGEQMILNEH